MKSIKSMKLTKILILFSLVFLMLSTPVFNFVTPVFASEVVGEEEEEEDTSVFHIGVNRLDSLESNREYFSDNVMSVAKIIFAFLVFVMIILIGIKAITESYDGKARAQIIEKFKHIIYGVILFSIATVIVAIAANFQETILSDLYDTEYAEISGPAEIDEELETNWLANIIEMGLKVIGRLLEIVLEFLFSIVSGNGFDSALDNQYTLNNVLFLADFGDSIDINAVNDYGVKLSTAPFTVAEWSRYTKAYIFLATVAVPLMFISIITVAFNLVTNAGNFEKVTEAKKTVMRIITGIIIIALGPYLFRAVLTFFNMLVFLIPVEFSFDIIIEDMDDANGLLSVITSLWWLWIKFRITLLFVVREIMLTVMYVITPIVIGFWAISEKTKAFNRWIGETITNAATQFCYALVFFIATIVLSGVQTNAFFTLLWLSMMLKLADFFKESFQNLFDKWSGINELQVSDGMAKSARGFNRKLAESAMDKIDPNRVGGFTRGLSNIYALTDFAESGKLGFTTKNMAIDKQAKADKADAMALIKDLNAIKARSDYKQLVDHDVKAPIESWSDSAQLEFYYQRLMSAKNQKEKDKLQGNIDAIIAANPGDNGIKTIVKTNNDLMKAVEDYDKQAIIADYAKKQRKTDGDKTFGKFYQSPTMGMVEARAYEEYEKSMKKTMGKSEITMPSTVKIGNSDLKLDEEKIRKQMVASGFNPNQGTNPNYNNERLQAMNQIVAPVNKAFDSANRAIKNQEKGASIATDAIKQENINKSNSAIKSAIESSLELYRSNGQELDKKMAKKLTDYTDMLGANGESGMQEKYAEEIEKMTKKD
ncbi:MAG: hypothetical protein MJ244_02860 [Clostridia bacterium]|nr:hypothetical protein [Clostridia bacterium]